MLESIRSLLPITEKNPMALCIGFEIASLNELERLLETLGLKTREKIRCGIKQIHPGTYLGKGKLEEIKNLIQEQPTDVVIVDTELSPNQLKNIENFLKKPVLDRPGVIIEIFSKHARSKEAKTQVELARLQYLLPRLTHFWTHFERQRGGIGLKGMGEKQIEVDRRLVKKRMQILRERLKEIEKERALRRENRENLMKVAVVGYTNAGKSTLINALAQSSVRAEDKLFATLDPSVRALTPSSRPPIVLIDTVGFIRNLPPSLVASFRSTLEEMRDADVLLHVLDAHSEEASEELKVTQEVLKELNLLDKPKFIVLNKSDLVGKDFGAKNRLKTLVPGALVISALDTEDVKKLREKILNYFTNGFEVWEIVIPYSDSKVDAQLYAHARIERKKHLEQGTFYRVRIDGNLARKLDLVRYRTSVQKP